MKTHNFSWVASFSYATFAAWMAKNDLVYVAISAFVAAIVSFFGAKASKWAWEKITHEHTTLRISNIWTNSRSTFFGLTGLAFGLFLIYRTPIDHTLIFTVVVAPSLYLVFYGKNTPTPPTDPPFVANGIGITGSY
jgi:hypothetical protein